MNQEISRVYTTGLFQGSLECYDALFCASSTHLGVDHPGAWVRCFVPQVSVSHSCAAGVLVYDVCNFKDSREAPLHRFLHQSQSHELATVSVGLARPCCSNLANRYSRP